jgi:hypothetical protein
MASDTKFGLTAVAVTALLLTACGQGVNDETTCDYASENLLEDPGFSTLMEPIRSRSWHYSQHAGDKSFAYAASDGILTFEKVGSESWGLLAQPIDTKNLEGRRVEYTAELKLDLSDPVDTHGFGYGGGLSLLARANNRVVLHSSLDHEPHMGVHDWQAVRIVADLPEGISYLRIGLLHQAGGMYQARNPALRIVAGGCEPTLTAE